MYPSIFALAWGEVLEFPFPNLYQCITFQRQTGTISLCIYYVLCVFKHIIEMSDLKNVKTIVSNK